ncbi:MAG: hypothetical protein JNL01_00630 [Bdellovibrionales bacterium]|nr:hypothetical protein [Bdellovibrionales bacterium]
MMERQGNERRLLIESQNSRIDEKKAQFQKAFENYLDRKVKTYPEKEAKDLRAAQAQARAEESRAQRRFDQEQTRLNPEQLTDIIQTFHRERNPEGFSKRRAFNPAKDVNPSRNEISQDDSAQGGKQSGPAGGPAATGHYSAELSEGKAPGQGVDPNQGLDPNHFEKELKFPEKKYDLWKGIKRQKQ